MKPMGINKLCLEVFCGGPEVFLEKYEVDFGIGSISRANGFAIPELEKPLLLSPKNIRELKEKIHKVHIENWKAMYEQLACDGESWKLVVFYEDGEAVIKEGFNADPNNWLKLERCLKNTFDRVFEESKPKIFRK